MEFMSDQMVHWIEKHADELAKLWLRDVCACERTPKLCALERGALYESAFNVYNELSKWISRDTTREEIARHYLAFGRQRRRDGLPLSEVIESMVLMRRRLWLKVLSEGLIDTALELRKAMELNNRIVLFFDRAMYYAAVGYESEAGAKATAAARA
jgi:hypothetical protein